MSLYTIFLPLHSIVRWLVVIFGLLAFGRALLGLIGKKPWTALDNRLGMLYTIGMDTQVLIGMILYLFLSPLTQSVFQNFGGAMSNAAMRFFGLEHLFYMIVALAFSHMGRTLARKAQEPLKKHRVSALWYGLSFAVLLAGIPWPFVAQAIARPWIRF